MLFAPREHRERRSTVVTGPSLQETLQDRRVLSNGVWITPETSTQRVAVFAAANLIATNLSQLPLDCFRGKGPKKQEIPKSSFLEDPGGEGYGFADWAWSVFWRTLLQGNTVGYINSVDAYGFPESITLQDLNMVAARYVDGQREWKLNGDIVPTDRIFHMRAFPAEKKILGLSPVGMHMRTIGTGLMAEQYASDFYRDGGHPTGMLVSEAPLNDAKAKTIKEKFMEALRGSRGPVVMPAQIRYERIQISPVESQFLETQAYTSAECARIFGPGVPEMLGYETGGTMTYANVEQRSLHLLMYTFNAWARRLEYALSTPRMTPRGQHVRFNRKAMLQAITLDRFRAHEVALKNGWETVNEVREIEDMPPVAWGDEPFTPAIGPAAVPAAPPT